MAALELLGPGLVGAATLNTAATRVSVVGDSLTLGTLPYQADALTGAGWARSTIDAHGSRGIRTKVKSDRNTGLTAVDAIRETSGDSVLWVVALGTNDAGLYPKPKQPDMIRLMMDHIGSGHRVLWVNIYLPAKPVRHQSWNAALQTVADERPDEMFIFDWAKLATENPHWLAHDQIHCSGKGYAQRSAAIAQATRVLVPAGRSATEQRSSDGPPI
ncbi:MAG: GDSL-type esterase/lipase family protein [Ilumatobacteraceae bacterium]